MPRLWSDTIREHRDAVRDATLDAAATVVSRRGYGAATMSEIAETAGISRATLYKYYPDVQSVLTAWHERQIAHHLAQLEKARDAADPSRRLEAVLRTYALQQRDRGASALRFTFESSHHSAAQHGPNASTASRHLTELFATLIGEQAAVGTVRTDVSPSELAVYCLHALSAAERFSSDAAIRRLCTIVRAGMRPPK